MTRYRMRVYTAGDQLWQTHDILAEDDATAKHLAHLPQSWPDNSVLRLKSEFRKIGPLRWRPPDL